MIKTKLWKQAYQIGDAGLEKYRKTWKKEYRGCRDCLADVIKDALVESYNAGFNKGWDNAKKKSKL